MLLPDIFVPYLRDYVSHYFILQVSPKLLGFMVYDYGLPSSRLD